MLLCDAWRVDPGNSHRVTIDGLISSIRAIDDPPYPLLREELCVFLILTGGHGQGQGHIACVFEDTGQTIFESGRRPIVFGPDPLEVVGVPFRIRDCRFPFPGLYAVQFWYDEVRNGRRVGT
jgi:hypothetical protein